MHTTPPGPGWAGGSGGGDPWTRPARAHRPAYGGLCQGDSRAPTCPGLTFTGTEGKGCQEGDWQREIEGRQEGEGQKAEMLLEQEGPGSLRGEHSPVLGKMHSVLGSSQSEGGRHSPVPGEMQPCTGELPV